MAGVALHPNHPTNPAFEPLRRQDTLTSSIAATPPPVARPFDRPPPPLSATGGGGTPQSTGAPLVKAPTPGSGARPSVHSFDRDYFLERRSVDSGVRTPMLPAAANNKRGPPRSRTGSIRNQHYPEMMDDSDGAGVGVGTFDLAQHQQNQPAFLGSRGRPMSFYDMKEKKRGTAASIHQQQQQQQHQNQQLGVGQQATQQPSPPESFVAGPDNRNSWASADYPYNYADMISGHGTYAPPRMGQASAAAMGGRGGGGFGGGGGGSGGSGGNSISDKIPLRLPWTMWMNSEIKNHFVCAIGEWVGTTMFLFFAFAGTQVANAKSTSPADSNTTTNATAGFNPIVMLYISVSFGFSLMVNVWIFFRISGGLFNPAVTLALWATGALRVGRAITLFCAQIVGSITASALVLAIFPTPFNVRTTLSEGTSLAQGIFIETFATAELVFTILMLAKEKHRATFIAPVGIGLALFTAELVAVYYTGGSLNPARSFGPCVVTGTFDTTHWIYWLGPFMGCIFAIAFYKFIKILEYEMANPGQDGDDENDPTKNPSHRVRESQRETTAKILARMGFIPPSYAYTGVAAGAGLPGTAAGVGGMGGMMLADSDTVAREPFAMQPEMEEAMAGNGGMGGVAAAAHHPFRYSGSSSIAPNQYHRRQSSSAGENSSMMRGNIGAAYEASRQHDPAALSTVASMSGSVKETAPMQAV